MTVKEPAIEGVPEIPAELLRLTENAGISFEISAAFENLRKQQEYASKAHEYTRLEIEAVIFFSRFLGLQKEIHFLT